jgi:hypothetical protein
VVKTEEEASEKGKKFRILIHNPCSLNPRGNEVENRTLRSPTHLFFAFHENFILEFRALLRFSDISNASKANLPCLFKAVKRKTIMPSYNEKKFRARKAIMTQFYHYKKKMRKECYAIGFGS